MARHSNLLSEMAAGTSWPSVPQHLGKTSLPGTKSLSIMSQRQCALQAAHSCRLPSSAGPHPRSSNSASPPHRALTHIGASPFLHHSSQTIAYQLASLINHICTCTISSLASPLDNSPRLLSFNQRTSRIQHTCRVQTIQSEAISLREDLRLRTILADR